MIDIKGTRTFITNFHYQFSSKSRDSKQPLVCFNLFCKVIQTYKDTTIKRVATIKDRLTSSYERYPASLARQRHTEI